jgi:uncharacterized repeat protein (TIGR01451 family)
LPGVYAWLLLLVPQLGWAAGTPAGTVISNVATVNYSLSGNVQPPLSNVPTTFRVDELIQPVLTWQDAAPVAVDVTGTNDALTFLLTNSGNGPEAFSLSRTNGPAPLPAGNYTPLNGTVGSIYLESGLQAGFQASGPNADTAYVPGTNDPNLAPDAGQILYVISNTPNVAANIHGDVLLAAASLTAGAAGSAPGTGLAGLGQGGGFAVVGTSRAQAGATGSYLTNGMNLAVNKTVASVLDPKGSDVLMPGAMITYQIEVKLTGTGAAANLVIADPLPANTTYVPNSITVACVQGTFTGTGACTGITIPQPAAAKTDTNADADSAQLAANTVSVSLGNVAAPANVVITFRATIN